MNRYRLALTAVAVLIVAAVLFTVVRMPAPPATASTTGGQVAPVSDRHPAPDFTGIDGWLNSSPLTLAGPRGKGLPVVGVLSLEFDFEMIPTNVAAAVTRLGVTWPVAIDSQMATWNAYRNQYWPAEYLLDQQGRVAYTTFGEGAYAQTDAAVAQLLGIGQAALPSATPVPSNTTPELYLGSQRGALADGETYAPIGRATTYPDHGSPQTPDLPQIIGRWTDEGQYLQADSAGHVRLQFQADSLYVVAGGSGPALHVAVTLDGKSVGTVDSGPALTGSGFTVSRQDLFQLLGGVSSGYHLIDLTVPAGFRIYTFTFG